MRAALVFLLLSGCTSTSNAPPSSPADAAAPARADLALARPDLVPSPPPPVDLAGPPPDLGDAPDLAKCQPQYKPLACGCPGLTCCTGTVNGQTFQFCAGTNTVTPDPTQRCFDPGDPHCRTCGALGNPCCFDGNPPMVSCRPGFECHQVKCAVATNPTCFACDRAGCGLLPGAPCCTLPPYVCTNGMQCQNGVCR